MIGLIYIHFKLLSKFAKHKKNCIYFMPLDAFCNFLKNSLTFRKNAGGSNIKLTAKALELAEGQKELLPI